MSSDPIDKALAWSGVAALDPLWDELARRMSASDRAVRAVHVEKLDHVGRRALASLFGWERLPQSDRIRVDVARLATGLGLDEEQLRHLVERLRGPLPNRARHARESAAAREAMWVRAEERLGDRIPRTIARLRLAGVPDGDVEAHESVLIRLADALALLPVDPPIPLPMLAWRVCGDPHGLDVNATCGRYLQLAALELAGEDLGQTDAATIRRCLRRLGVVSDRLSTTTIVLRLRSTCGGPLDRLLAAAEEANVPAHISGAILDASAPRFAASSWLCVENPSVIEYALAAGASRPIVCTSGWPSIDTQRLLSMATEQGVELAYAGDYDATGLEIAAWMATRFGARIVMTASLYEAADLEQAPPWSGAIPETPWSPTLCEAIRRRGRVVYQEDPAVLAGLFEGNRAS